MVRNHCPANRAEPMNSGEIVSALDARNTPESAQQQSASERSGKPCLTRCQAAKSLTVGADADIRPHFLEVLAVLSVAGLT